MDTFWENNDELFLSIMSVLAEYSNELAEHYKQRLEAGGKRASGKLIDTIKPFVKRSTWGWDAGITVQDYWKYVEKGLKGRGNSRKNSDSPFPVPRSRGAIAYWLEKNGWLEAKGLPRESKWAIATTIWNEGIKKGNQFEEANQAVNAMYLPKVQEAINEDFQRVEYKVWSDITKMIKV